MHKIICNKKQNIHNQNTHKSSYFFREKKKHSDKIFGASGKIFVKEIASNISILGFRKVEWGKQQYDGKFGECCRKYICAELKENILYWLIWMLAFCQLVQLTGDCWQVLVFPSWKISKMLPRHNWVKVSLSRIFNTAVALLE